MSATPDGTLAHAPAKPLPPRPTTTEPYPVTALARVLDASVRGGDGGAVITGATLRADEVRPGDLFAALPGARVHGADFAGTAITAGAAALLTDPAGAGRRAVRESGLPVLVREDPRRALGSAAAAVYGDPSATLNVLGVTGTSGKTTTSYLVQAGLAAAGRTTGLIGTVETRLGGARLPSAFTTPEAPDLQALFALMVEQGVTDVSMEVSSHALTLGRADAVHFAVGAFNNLSQDHLDFHVDMEDYFAAKARLFDGRAATEVVNVDSDWGRRLVRGGTVTVSADPDHPEVAGWTLSGLRVSTAGEQSFVAHGPSGDRVAVELKLPGMFNVANAMLAVAMLRAVDVDPADIAHGLSTVDVPGRMERVSLGQDFTALIDYSHKPAAVAQMLASVREQLRRAQSPGRIILVLGCGGDRDAGKRPLMGAEAAAGADVLVITDDNPRTEDPAAIRADMRAGAVSVLDGAEVVEVGDRADAIAEAVHRARTHDVVVVAGKGHETGQYVHGVAYPFSDADELTRSIRAHLGEVAPT